MAETAIALAATTADPRRSPPHDLVVQRINSSDGRKSFLGYVENLSKSGMFIGTQNPREPGARLLVELPLPMPLGKRLQCEVEVIWSRRYSHASKRHAGMGVKFLALPPALAEVIQTWVANNK